MKLVQDTPDWSLPLKHESAHWRNFLAGGRTFIDIGAHVGTWALHLAPQFKRVFCFEPDERAFRALHKNLALNNIRNVEVIPAAVADKVGTTTINLFHNPCTNTIMDPVACLRGGEEVVARREVPTVTVDAFVAERGITDLDFLKVDAEAAEMRIVKGALRTLETQRPDFFIEMHGLFYERLRAMLPFLNCDVIDGGRAGLSLVSHRDRWPGYAGDDFRIFPAGTSPTAQDMKDLRKRHGIEWDAPTSGFLSVGGE